MAERQSEQPDKKLGFGEMMGALLPEEGWSTDKEGHSSYSGLPNINDLSKLAQKVRVGLGKLKDKLSRS